MSFDIIKKNMENFIQINTFFCRIAIFEEYTTNNVYKFITNNISPPVLKLAELYRERWNVRTFLKFARRHMLIKSLYGTSRNAVYTQILIVVCDNLLLLMLK